MKRLLLFTLLPALAGAALANSLNIDPNQSKSISVSNATSNPTQILTNDASATRTFIVNSSTNNIFIVGYSTISALGISSAAIVSTSLTSGSYFIAAATTTIANGPVVPNVFSPDGIGSPYTGPMWATSGGSGAVIQVFRSH